METIMRTDLKMTKTEIKNQLIKQFGKEIKNERFDIVKYPSFCEMEKVYDLKYYYEFKYKCEIGIDDGNPYFSIYNINFNELIDIITMNFSFGWCLDTLNDAENKYDLLTDSLLDLGLH